jgi:hypothetical protein
MSAVGKILNLFIVECNLPIKIQKPLISAHTCLYIFSLLCCEELTLKVCRSILEYALYVLHLVLSLSKKGAQNNRQHAE